MNTARLAHCLSDHRPQPFGCRFRTGRIVLVLGVVTMIAAARDGMGRNVLRNGGFEEGEESPSGWSFAWKTTHRDDPERGIEKQEPDWAWDTQVHHSGRRSIRMGVERAVDDAVWSQENVPAVPGTKIYLARAWIRTENLRNTDLRMGCVSLSAAGKWLGANYTVLQVSNDRTWQPVVGLFEPHPKAATFRVRLWLNMGYTGTGRAWVDDVELLPTDLREAPGIQFVDSAPMPPVGEEDRAAGYVVFRRHYLELVFPNSVPRPDELGTSLAVRGTPGERVPVSFSLRALRDLGEIQVSATDLVSGGGRIDSARVSVQPVKCLVRGGQSRWGPYADGNMLRPVFVEETDRTEIPADTTRQFWVTVRIPPEAPAGEYRGTIALRGGRETVRKLDLKVTVHPFRLLTPPDISWGMYTRFRDDPEWLREAYRDMRAHGMTTIGLCGPLGADVSMVEGAPRVAWSPSCSLEKAVEAYGWAGFTRPLLWLMSADVIRFSLRQGELGSEAFAACYRGIIEQIVARGRRSGWPEIIFQPVDEPYEHAVRPFDRKRADGPTVLEVARRCLQILKSVPGVRTEEDGANGAPRHFDSLHPWVDVEVFHDGPVLRRGTYDAEGWREFLAQLKRESKEVWFYNTDITGFHPEPLRFGYGFGLFKAGARGALNWSYMFGYRPEKPEGLYKAKLPMVHRYNRTDTEAGGPTLAWEAAREGVDDYRYLYTFLQECERSQAPEKGDLAAEARKEVFGLLEAIDFRGSTGRACQGEWTGEKGVLDNGTKFVSGTYEMKNGLTFEDYDRIRRILAEWIVRLRAAR